MRSDEELMKSYREGSEAGFNELYGRYSPMVYGFIQKRLRHEEVEDFYQKVWRQLHEKRSLYRDQPFLPWFFTLIRHLLVDEYRSLGRKREREEALRLKHDEESHFDVEDLLSRLSEETRELVKKHYLDEISYPELEKELGLSQNTIRQRLSRAIKTLRGVRDET